MHLLNALKNKPLIVFLGFLLTVRAFAQAGNNFRPTTLVFPPYLHTYGIRKATRFHLFLFMGNRVKFRDPQGLAVVRLVVWDDTSKTTDDDEVVVYGVNSRQNNIIFNTSMTSLGVYGLNAGEPERLRAPHGITANANGDVYVADTGNNRVVRLLNTGHNLHYISEITGDPGQGIAMQAPRDVSLDATHWLFVADTDNDRVLVFDKNDRFAHTFGTSGVAPGQLHRPVAVCAVSDSNRWNYFRRGFVVLVDLDRTRLQIFSRSGDFKKAVNVSELFGNKVALMYLAVDYYSNIYVTDSLNHCIHKLDRNLNYLTSFGRYGKDDFEFIEPRGIAIFRRFGQVFIAEKFGAQYYWIGTDVRNLNVRVNELSRRIVIDFTITEPSFVTADVFRDDGEFFTRIWNRRFQFSGYHRDIWNGRLINWPDSILAKDGLHQKGNLPANSSIPPGNYRIRYRFEPTYSSYKHFKKEVTAKFTIRTTW